MQIHLMHPGQPVADFAIAGTTVTVAGVAIDCAARQQDVALIIEIRSHNGVAVEGEDGAYLAQIQIPARRYETVEPEQGGNEGDEPPPEAQPLDTNAIVITLWPTV